MDFDSSRYEIRSFVANSVLEAAQKIRTELGSDAIVLDIRQIKAEGISKLWKKPRIEILACKSKENQEKVIDRGNDERFEAIKSEIENLKSLIEQRGGFNQRSDVSSANNRYCEHPGGNLSFHKDGDTDSNYLINAPVENFIIPIREKELLENRAVSIVTDTDASDKNEPYNDWKFNLLKKIGIEPTYIPLILERWHTCENQISNNNIHSLLEVLKTIWGIKQFENLKSGIHIFIGTPGSGKSVLIGKIASRLVLSESATVSIARLDATTANTSELPFIYGEILGIPSIALIPEVIPDSEYIMVDLPGINPQNNDDFKFLTEISKKYPNANFHLVLNVCYETRLLLNQIKTFGRVVDFDLMFTHIDEEPRLGKLFNFKLGTNYMVSYLAGGQNIPGFLEKGEFNILLSRIFPRK